MNSPLFSRRVLIIFTAAIAAMFALSIIIPSTEESIQKGNNSGPGVYSKSAVGYAGFFELLEKMGVKVRASERNPLADAGRRGTLIIAEPMLEHIMSGENDSSSKLLEARRLLLVLPKWNWARDEKKPEWISKMLPKRLQDAEIILALRVSDSSVSRREKPDNWEINELGYQPSFGGAVQVIKLTDDMRPIVADGENALVAEVTEDDKTVWILSDPDIMSNHGIMNGNNGAFMLSLVEKLSSMDNKNNSAQPVIVFDETVHGFFAVSDSLLKMMLSFPFLIILILLLISAAALVWAGFARFGAAAAPKPVLDFGKERLIENCARLLDYGGHHAVILERYALSAIVSAAEILHAPKELDVSRGAEWMDVIGRSRGISMSAVSLLQELSEARGGSKNDISRLTDIARRVRQWKGEILNESGIHSQYRKRGQA